MLVGGEVRSWKRWCVGGKRSEELEEMVCGREEK